MKRRTLRRMLPVVLAVAALTVAFAPSAAATVGPVGWWKLDETSGATAYDSSGNGNDGAISGGVTLNSGGQFGTSFGFDGAAGVVEIASSGSTPAVLRPSSFTVSAWVNPSKVNPYGCLSGSACAVISNEGVGRGLYGYGLRVFPTGSLWTAQWCFGGVDRRARNCAYSDVPVPMGVWTHIVGTYDGVGELRVYVNGVLSGPNLGHNRTPSAGGIATGLGAHAVTTNEPLFIGRTPSGGSPLFWYGLIDDVRIYDRVLTGSEILSPPDPLATPTSKDDCKKGGWQTYVDDTGRPFKNQGDCVSYVATGGKNKADG